MSWFGRGEVDGLQRRLTQEQVQREAAEAEAQHLRAAFDAVPAGIVLVDETGRTLLRNTGASIGGHADVLVEEALEQLLQAAARGRAGEQRLNLYGPPPRVLLVRGIPLEGGSALAIVDDLSERVRLDTVRTDFVANISHELKTPVGALAVLAEALVDNDDLTVNRHLATKMVDEAYRASRTIDDLLELSRIELGGQGEPEEVSLAAVLGEAVARHRLTADTAGVCLVLASAGGQMVVGDRLQLVSAVSNLIDNAIKYSNPGGAVRVGATTTGRWVEIEVADDGIGIPARDLDRVFERFYRVDRARSRDTGGTGLGLAIVHHIATNHGGEVSVQSHEGEGSAFTLRIPAQEEA